MLTGGARLAWVKFERIRMCASRGKNGASGASFKKGSFRKPQIPSLGCPRVGMPHTDEAVRGRPSGLTDETPDFRQEATVGCPSVQSSRHPTKRTISASLCLSLSLPCSTSLPLFLLQRTAMLACLLHRNRAGISDESWILAECRSLDALLSFPTSSACPDLQSSIKALTVTMSPQECTAHVPPPLG